jgi:PAS domain S-box-containing protein
VLLVDDLPAMRTHLAAVLAPSYEVETASDGLEALRAARARKPDLIVSDVTMPVLDGYGLLRALRADETLRATPVVLLSGRGGEDATVEGLGHGAVDFLSKPFSPRELVARVRAQLELAEARAELARRELATEIVRASEEALRLAVWAADLGLWSWDLRTGSLQLSETCRALLAIGTEADVGPQRLLESIEPEDRTQLVSAVRRAIGDREELDLEVRVARADGSRRWVAVRGRSLFDDQGRPSRMTGVARDVTDRRHAEDALRESDRRKSEFLAMLSHELRNPLAPLRNGLYVLERVAPESAQAERAKAMMDRQLRHLTRIVDELIDVARIERGTIVLHRERVDVDAIARRAVEDYAPIFANAGVELVLLGGEPLWANADPMRLAQAIGNLLQNAARFTPRGGRTTVSTARDVARAAATIRVRDTGNGLSPELLPRLFETFSQARQSLARSEGGLGLGLSFVKGIMSLHGGDVAAESAGPGRGSTFTLSLPLAVADAIEGPCAGPAARARPSASVLVIEDNVDAASSIRDALELVGHAVAVAFDGAEGIAMARELAPDVVVCDIGLPGMDGYEVAQAIRADASLARTALVALTGYAAPADVEKAKRAGFDRHLAKPSSVEEIESAVEALRPARALAG